MRAALMMAAVLSTWCGPWATANAQDQTPPPPSDGSAATTTTTPPPDWANGSSGPPAKAAAPNFPGSPRLGGHFGLALPILSISNDGNSFLGRDFAQVGITPGITVKITDRWAVDFEFIGFSRWDLNASGVPDKAHTIFVVDPGVVYNFGPVAAGLRLAVQIGEGIPLNFGAVPIVVVPFTITKKLSYFLELDLPIFVFSTPGTPAVGPIPATDTHTIGSFNVLFQTGFAF